MIKVEVYKQSGFPVSAKKIRERITQTLESNGISSDFDVSVAVVGSAKMLELGKKYYGENDNSEEHPIFTFPDNEVKEPFTNPPDETTSLGEIVISYPQAVEESKQTGRLVDDIVCDLAEHGSLHLLGIHH